MFLKTILNRIEKQPGFVYRAIRWRTAEQTALEIELRPRRGARPICSGCSRRRASYDTLKARAFAYVPLWGLPVFFLYAMRRVHCPRCGVRVEAVPWAAGKRRTTTSFDWFLAAWAKRLNWTEVAQIFGTSWETVFRAVERAVDWGRAHADYTGLEAIGVDEIQWKAGQTYLAPRYS